MFIRLCIDFLLINDLIPNILYPMPLIMKSLEVLEGALSYQSLNRASEFGVVGMTERARRISAFVTPLKLFE